MKNIFFIRWLKYLLARGAYFIKGLITLLLLFNLQAYSQEKTEKELFSLKMEDVPLKTIFKYIEDNSSYTFVYNNNSVDDSKIVSIDIKDATILELCDAVFKGLKFYYKIEKEHIIVSQQEETSFHIEGKIFDDNKDPLPGVNIMLNGLDKGTITNINGAFRIDANLNDTLFFSFLGYNPEKFIIKNNEFISIMLIPNILNLEEVIKVGYSTQKKVNLTGSIESIKRDQLANRAATNVANTLTGQVAGLTVLQASGQPGRDAGIMQIRGVGTIRTTENGGIDLEATGALIIVDGVEVSSLSYLPVDDIETISVLKDAASTAIYGVRAANGVVLVTTKRGTVGKTQITYRGQTGFQQPTQLPNYLGAADYAMLYNEACKNDGVNPVYTEGDIEKFRNGSDPDNYPNTDWINEYFSIKNAPVQNHYLGLIGGKDKNKFALSLNYTGKEGNIPNSSYNRYNIRSNLDHEVNDKLNVAVNISYAIENLVEPAYGITNTYEYALREPPVIAKKFSNGNWGAYSSQHNSVAMITDGGGQIEDAGSLISSINVNYKPFKGVAIDIIGSVLSSNRTINNFKEQFDVYNTPDELGKSFRSSVSKQKQNSIEYDFSPLLKFNKEISSHSFNLLLGFNAYSKKYDYLGGLTYDLPQSNKLDQIDAGSADTEDAWGNLVQYRRISQFGRLNYNYAQRYLVEVNYRYDGTSRFPSNNRFDIFPSFAVGWRISNEDFMKSVDIINNLKLRVSWGMLGNENIGLDYPYQQVYSLGGVYSFNGQIVPTITESTLANQDISWESSTLANIGVDIGLWNNSLVLTAEYFYKITSEILLSLDQPRISGALRPYPLINAGEVLNTGTELILAHKKTLGKFSYNILGNFTYIYNEILDMKGADVPGMSVGDPVYNIYGYISDGLFTDGDDIENSPDHSVFGTVKPGDIKYKDIDGNGIINSDDRKSIGSYFPKVNYGLNITANYNRIDFSMILQGVAGVMRELNYQSIAFVNGGKVLDIHLDRWTEENPDPNAKYPRLTLSTERYAGEVNDFFVYNTGYIKCRNIQVGYSLSKKLLDKIKVQKIRVYAGVDNAFTITKLENFDPEVLNGRGAVYPQVRTAILGLNINL